MKRKNGFTLIELMVTMAIFLIASSIISSILVQGYKIMNRTNNKLAIQDEVRNVIMNIEASAVNAKEIKIRTTDAITNYNGKEANEILFIKKDTENIVYIEVVTSENFNSLIELKLNTGGTIKSEKILLNNIQASDSNRFALQCYEEGNVFNINFIGIVNGSQISGQEYVLTISKENAQDIIINMDGTTNPVIPPDSVEPEVPEIIPDTGDEVEDFINTLGEDYISIFGKVEFQSNSTHIDLIGNGTIGYGEMNNEGKNHFETGKDKVFQREIDSISLNNVPIKDITINDEMDIINNSIYFESNGFKIIFVNGDIEIGIKNDDKVTLDDTIIICNGNIELSKNNVELKMNNSIIFSNSIKFHNKSKIIFNNTLPSKDIINTVKDELREELKKYNEVLGVTFSITSSWDGGANYKIILENNSDKNITGWEIEFESEKDITACWHGVLESLGGNKYRIRNYNWNANIAANNSISIEGSCSGYFEKIKNINIKYW